MHLNYPDIRIDALEREGREVTLNVHKDYRSSALEIHYLILHDFKKEATKFYIQPEGVPIQFRHKYYSTLTADYVYIDYRITSIADEILLPRKLGDFLWKEFFNSWELVYRYNVKSRTEPRLTPELIIRFDTESDARRFEELCIITK